MAPAAEPAEARTPESYDLTFEVAKYLDRHLVFPLLEYLSQQQSYDAADIERAKLELIEKTNMVDYAVDIYQGLYQTDEVPESLTKRRSDVVSKLKALESQVKPITEFLSNEDHVKLLKQDKTQNMAFLQKEFGIGPDQVDALYHYAKWNFECGNYSAASEYLYHYRALSTHPERSVSALWGKVAADILLQDFGAAMDDLLKLKELLDIDSFASMAQQLQQKAWLMHWALFIFFNHENGMNALIDLFMQDRYLTAIQLSCPHLLRYLSVAVVVNKRRRNVLKDLVKVISQESYEYRDPVTDFLRCLYAEADFEGAQAALSRCEAVLRRDFFLVGAAEPFMASARAALFETYCRVHRAVSLHSLSEQLGMADEDAEKWVVDLVRGARLSAKVDAAAGAVVMQAQGASAYEGLLDKARGLSLRTFALANTVVGMLRT